MRPNLNRKTGMGRGLGKAATCNIIASYGGLEGHSASGSGAGPERVRVGSGAGPGRVRGGSGPGPGRVRGFIAA